jgi:hypothetical protein
MSPQPPPHERYAADLERTVDRVRTMALTRLGAAFEPEPTRADAVRRLAQRLADDAAALAGEPLRPLPRLADQAVGDQLAVVGHDLAAAALAAGRPEALDAPAEELLALRRRL